MTTDEQLAAYPREVEAVAALGLHPHEAIPRDQTFIHERLNWQRQCDRLQGVIDAVRPLFDCHGPVTGSPEWREAWRKSDEALGGVHTMREL